MPKSVVPMIHVPDVAAAVAWYEALGFQIVDTYSDDGEMSFAMVSFGETAVVFNEGGKPSDAHRREVDLYLNVDDVEARWEELKDKVEVFEPLHDTFYGAREFIIRDLNRFWITFGQRIAGREESPELRFG